MSSLIPVLGRWRDRAAGSPAASWVALVAAVASSTTLVAVAPRHSGAGPVLAVVAAGSGGAVAVLEQHTRRLGGRVVAVAIGLILVVAVVTPPRTSNDLWSYGAYGRLVVVHHESPYTSTPGDHPGDPFSRRVSMIWKHTRSVYGPVWTGVSAADAAVVGGSTLGNRLVFQSIAAAAVGATLLLVWRRTRSSAALAWLGLHPVFSAVTVNGGHVDALVGLAVLGAALLAARARPVAAGITIAVATLIKVTGVLGAVGILFWLWRSGRRGSARRMAAAIGVTLVVGYFPVVDSLGVLAHADHLVSAWSPWNGLADALLGHEAWRAVAHPLAYNETLVAVSTAGLALTAVLLAVLGWRAARAADPREAAGTAAATYPLAAAYSLPWYADLALPSFAAHTPSVVGWIVWIDAAVMLVTLKMPIHPTGTLDDQLARGALTYVVPIALLMAFVWAALRSRPTTAEVSPVAS